jgi:alanyl-tRNA synthetase
VVPPNSTAELPLGLARTGILPGAFHASILRVTDSTTLTQIDLPASATGDTNAGLWVGEATPTGVGSFVQGYAGTEISTLAPSLRLLLHVSGAGSAHLLSQAFFQLFGAETRGFRITSHSTEIDLALDGLPEELPHKIQQAEDLANQIVFEDRPVRTFEVTPEVAASLPLRKESFLPDCVRLVEIADFDLSPCGGTHATRTGEVGLITVRAFERAKKMTRLHVLCGIRALADHRRLRQTLDTAARRLSVGPDELPEAIGRLQAESQLLQRRLRSLTQVVADAEAATLLDALPDTPGRARVVARVFDGGEGGKDLESLTLLAHRLIARPGVLALLATVDGETYRLVLARSSDLDCDVQQMIRQLCTTYGGRGGGTPSLAQGGLPAAHLSAETLTAALVSMG